MKYQKIIILLHDTTNHAKRMIIIMILNLKLQL